jgi:hypothetical protein
LYITFSLIQHCHCRIFKGWLGTELHSCIMWDVIYGDYCITF